MITRSDGSSPERMTRRPSRRSPIWTCFSVTTSLGPTVRMMWPDWSGRTGGVRHEEGGRRRGDLAEDLEPAVDLATKRDADGDAGRRDHGRRG